MKLNATLLFFIIGLAFAAPTPQAPSDEVAPAPKNPSEDAGNQPEAPEGEIIEDGGSIGQGGGQTQAEILADIITIMSNGGTCGGGGQQVVPEEVEDEGEPEA